MTLSSDRPSGQTPPTRDVAKQEELVSALHALVRETSHSPRDVTSGGPNGSYDWNQAAMRRAIARIMDLFGLAVTEIQ